jgi:asparagine synthetase B (glutamine-hydrolysing)
MCGIVGILGKTPVVPIIVEALKRLEYRGYASRPWRRADWNAGGRKASCAISSHGSRRIRCRAIRASGIASQASGGASREAGGRDGVLP